MLAPNTLRVVDPSGTELLFLGIDTATYILTALDLGFPQVRGTSEALPGQDGEVDTTQYVGARTVTAEVTLSQVGTGPLIDQLAAVMHPGRRNYLHVSRPDWPGERRILARGETFSCPPASLRTAQLGFRCPTGLFEDAVSQSVTLSPSGAVAGGMTFPETFPVTFDPGLVPGAALISVGGTVSAAPVLDIYGPCSAPLFRVVDTGEQMILSGTTIAAGDFVRVDFGARTILLNNDPSQSLYGQLDFANSTWLTLPVGDVQVVFSPQSPSTGCQAVLQWANRWI